MADEHQEPEHIHEQAEDLVQQHFNQQEREAANDLIRDAFFMLPDDLQELYHQVQELYAEGKFEESSMVFEVWLDRARKHGLI